MGSGNVKDNARAQAQFASFGNGPAAAMPPPPPPGPDLTDIAVKNARRMQMAQLLSQRGRASTFLAPPGGGGASLLGG